MAVIGFGGSGHEWSCAVISNDKVVALSEERVTRKKYGLGSDLLAGFSRKTCLNALDLTQADIEYAVACSLVPRTFYHGFRDKIKIINHHLAHAYVAFLSSPCKEAAILIADNSGSIIEGDKIGFNRKVETISYFYAQNNEIKLINRVVGDHYLGAENETDYNAPGSTTNSIGHFYRLASLVLGFKFQSPWAANPFSEDGKTMGLAAYGDDRFVDKLYEPISLEGQGQIRLKTEGLEALFKELMGGSSMDEKAALAYAVQFHTERMLLHCGKYLYEQTGSENLCLAGGVALNSVANGLLSRELPFKNVFVAPAPSDDGVSLGCAYYAMHQLKNIPLNVVPKALSAYLGPLYQESRLEQALAKHKLKHFKINNLIERVAQLLNKGAIIGWFEGASEFGPRALGHRSILTAPFPAEMKDKLNNEVKFREWFRPYGAIVPLEKCSEYFDFKGSSPFMSFVSEPKHPELIPAAVHVNGTTRLQTVDQNMNARLHALLIAFSRVSGVPALINTSFNIAGEPIVETPDEAMAAALKMCLDYLVIEDYVIPIKAIVNNEMELETKFVYASEGL